MKYEITLFALGIKLTTEVFSLFPYFIPFFAE